MTSDVSLLFFAGSKRVDSVNKKLARLGAEIASANGINATFADLADYDMPLYDGDLETNDGIPEPVLRFKALMDQHQGIVIVCPEYNSSITPLLKNTLDWVSRVRGEGEEPLAVYKTRVFALAAASPGGLGGLRGMTDVRKILELGLGALVLPNQFGLPGAMQAFDERGHLGDSDRQEHYKTVIQKLAHAAHRLAGDS